MFRAALGFLMDNLSEIEQIAKGLYGADKQRVLYVKATRIENLLLRTRHWALALAREAEELEQRVKVLEKELEESRLK